jgi:hypothetical protein
MNIRLLKIDIVSVRPFILKITSFLFFVVIFLNGRCCCNFITV